MARPDSLDLRERVVAAGESCRKVAGRFKVSVASVVKWSQRFRSTGSAKAKRMGGSRLRSLAGERDWLLSRLAAVDDGAVGIDGDLLAFQICDRLDRTVVKDEEAVRGEAGNAVSVVIYTTDMRQFKEVVAARVEFFQKTLPTSTMVEVNHLADPGLLIEFQAIAVL